MTDPEDKSGRRDVEGPQDPLVERLRPEPSRPPEAGLTVHGFLGDSDRPGRRRLYLTTKLDYFVEFSVDDVLDSARIPAEKAPFPGTEATQVTLRKGAEISYTQSASVRPPDEFDLDLRRRRPPRSRPSPRYRADDDGLRTWKCQHDQWTNTDYMFECHSQQFWTCTCYDTLGSCVDTCEATTCGGCLPTEDYDRTLSCIETACSPRC
ncbi:hypothetical protein ACGFMM_32275 [Streptomyces sp. NPDC048604]|uniref:hypothetical protein n=1 Tax=Streptomyces sp. NPDC048604 TaxID=3365578 RepID=UPI003721F8DC